MILMTGFIAMILTQGTFALAAKLLLPTQISRKLVFLIGFLHVRDYSVQSFNIKLTGLFFIHVTTDEAGVVSAVSIQDKNREEQIINFSAMSTGQGMLVICDFIVYIKIEYIVFWIYIFGFG